MVTSRKFSCSHAFCHSDACCTKLLPNSASPAAPTTMMTVARLDERFTEAEAIVGNRKTTNQMKFEVRSPRLETNSNIRNLQFDLVSDFELRNADFLTVVPSSVSGPIRIRSKSARSRTSLTYAREGRSRNP